MRDSGIGDGRGWWCGLVLTAAGLAGGLGHSDAEDVSPGASGVVIPDEWIRLPQVLAQRPGEEIEVGRALSLAHCQACHGYPEPELLPHSLWEEEVLPKMGAMLGMHHAGYPYEGRMRRGATEEEESMVRQAGVYPNRAVLTRTDWEALTAFYMENAPDALPTSTRPAVPPTLNDRFAVRALTTGGESAFPSGVIHVSIDEERREVLVADEGKRTLSILDSGGIPRHTITSTSPIVDVRPERAAAGGRLWITTMGLGAFLPSDMPSGEIVVRGREDGFLSDGAATVLRGLRRPVHTAVGDLDRDGRPDLVVAEFGHQIGLLAWHRGLPDGRHERRILHPFPGALKSALHDFNGDGHLDVAAAFGQSWEGIYVFYNRGNGEFARSYAIQRPPTWGSSDFSLHDFDNDGRMDILAVNGDNGDHRPVLKPWHGIRIHRNAGSGDFEEVFFFPLPGAYGAVAADFDLDGDLDLAAVSYFPDFTRPTEGFVYLENLGNWRFEPSTFPEADLGRWMVIAAGDLDSDGDADIVLGSHAPGFPDAPENVRTRWEAEGKAVFLLENRTRDPAAR